MREEGDRKGGRLMLLYEESVDISFCRLSIKNKDFIHIQGKVQGEPFTVIIVYFSVSDKERNKSLREEIERIINKDDDTFHWRL